MARQFEVKLIARLSEGPARPGDLDEAVLGRFFYAGCMGFLPPYAETLGELIDEGRVKWARADDDTVWYELIYMEQT